MGENLKFGAGQHFERLIRLEDEELATNDDVNLANHLSDKDSCQVPMIPSSDDTQVKNLFQGSKHRQNNPGLGVHFTLNGSHIQINPEQLKYISLITLTFQNAALNLTMRAARIQDEQFSTPVAVTVAEILKLFTCIILIWYQEITIQATFKEIKTNLIDNYLDTLKVAVPSFVYYVQNNLLYIGSTHLDAATSQVTYQLKILTTAIFSVLMLNKRLSKIQWTALVVLFVGVAMIETIMSSDHKPKYSHQNVSLDESEIPREMRVEKPLLGFLAILTACCLSGFAGVYFEKILKNSSHISLWIRNIQLSVVTIAIGVIQLIVTEREHITDKGLLYGFTPLTWICIMLQAQGGLLVAVVVKFANNILKGFATSMAIVISTVASIFLFNFELTPTFVLGASLVIGSVMMYNRQ